MIFPASPFRYEREMLAPLAMGLPAQLGIDAAQIVRTIREVPLGLIIPDLLIGHWTPCRAPGAYPSTTGVDTFVRALLECEGPLSTSQIQSRLYLSDRATEASLKRLSRGGAVVPVGAAEGPTRDLEEVRWALAEEARAGCVGIVAVEAKLSRWQDAVRQAAEYLTFADRSVVVLDGNQVRESDALLAAVQVAQVGLVMQHGRVLRTVVETPAHAPPLSPARVLALTKLTTERGGRALYVQSPKPAPRAPQSSSREHAVCA